jgi:hypothetical protein
MNTLYEYQVKRIFMGRLPYGKNLLLAIQEFCEHQEIALGILSVIGALKRAELGFYQQEKKEYSKLIYDQELEIVSCTGNISVRDGKPMVHAHICLADSAGNSFGGHLLQGSIIFAAELVITELSGELLVRGYDELTGLPLWQNKP